MTESNNNMRPPENYSDWLICFEMIEKGKISDEQLMLLKKGTCSDFQFSQQYFCVQLEKTVNVILNKSIKSFNRKIKMQQLYHGESHMYSAFVRFENDSGKCLFFMELEFLPRSYREELFQSVKGETQRFIDTACKNIYKQCIKENNTALYDEIRLIKRIRPYREWEKIGL